MVVLRKGLQGEDELAHKWVVMPRYKLREEGETVKVNDHIILRNAQYKDLAISSFVQSDEEDSTLPSFVGMDFLSAVQKKAGIRIEKVQSARLAPTAIPSASPLLVDEEDDYVYGCDYLRVTQRQFQGHFICRVDDEDAMKSTVAPFGSVNKKQMIEKDKAYAVFVRSFAHQKPRVKRDFNTSYSGLGIWQVERLDSLQERVSYRDTVRLRHVISGQYLCVRPVEVGDCKVVSNNVIFTQQDPEPIEPEFSLFSPLTSSTSLKKDDQLIELEEEEEDFNYSRFFKVSIEKIEVKGLKMSDWLIEHEVYLTVSFKTELAQKTSTAKLNQLSASWLINNTTLKEPWVFHLSSNDSNDEVFEVTIFVKNKFRADRSLATAKVHVESLTKHPLSIFDEVEGLAYDEKGAKLCSVVASFRVESIGEDDFDMAQQNLDPETPGSQRHPRAPRLPVITSWSVATRSVPDATCDFHLLPLNERAPDMRSEGDSVRFGDNILLESATSQFRISLSEAAEKVSAQEDASVWWEYRGDVSMVPITKAAQKIVDKDIVCFERVAAVEVEDAWFASRLPSIARAATAVLQLTPTTEQLFVPSLRHLKNALNTYSLWTLGFVNHDGLLLDDVTEAAIAGEADVEELHVESADSDDDGMDVKVSKSDINVQLNGSMTSLRSGESLLADHPKPPKKTATSSSSKVQQSAMSPWLQRPVSKSRISLAAPSAFDSFADSKVHGFIEADSSTTATIIRRQSLLFELKLMEQLMQFLNICFLMERSFSSLNTAETNDYPYLDPMLKQCCEAIQVFFHACVHHNEKNALKMISMYGSFLFLISQQIMGWHTPIDLVLKLACQGAENSQKDDKSCLTRDIDVEISELENVLINAISPSDLRQILEQMYQMHANNHPSALHLLSMLDLLCKSSGKAKKFFQAALIRLLLPQSETMLHADRKSELFGSVLFQLQYEDFKWMVVFRSSDTVPTTSMSSLMASATLQMSLKAEAEGIYRLYNTYDSSVSGTGDDNLALQECYKLLEDLGFGGPCLYQEIGHLAGVRFWGFLQWWCFRACYFYPSTSISHYQMSPNQIMNLLDRQLTPEDLYSEMARQHIDYFTIHSALPFNRMITSRIPNFHLDFKNSFDSKAGWGDVNEMELRATRKRLRASLEGTQFASHRMPSTKVEFAAALSQEKGESAWFRASLRLVASLCRDGHPLSQRMVSSFLPAECLVEVLSSPALSMSDKGLMCDLITDVYVRNDYVFATKFLATKGSVAVCGVREDFKVSEMDEGLLFNKQSRLEFDVSHNHDEKYLRGRLYFFLQNSVPRIDLFPMIVGDYDHLVFVDALLRLFHELLTKGFFCDSEFSFFDDSMSSELERKANKTIDLTHMSLLSCEVNFINKLLAILSNHQNGVTGGEIYSHAMGAGLNCLAGRDLARSNFDTLDVNFPVFDTMFQEKVSSSILLRAVLILTDVRTIVQRIKMQTTWNIIVEASFKNSLVACTERVVLVDEINAHPEMTQIAQVLSQRSMYEEDLVKALFVGTLSSKLSVRRRSYSQLIATLSEQRVLEHWWDETEFRSNKRESSSLRLIHIKFEKMCGFLEEIFQNDRFERKYLIFLVTTLSDEIMRIVDRENYEGSASLHNQSGASRKSLSGQKKSAMTKNGFFRIRKHIIHQHLYATHLPCPPGEDDFFDLDLAKIRRGNQLLEEYRSKLRYMERLEVRRLTEKFALGNGVDKYAQRLLETIERFVQLNHIQDWNALSPDLRHLLNRIFAFLAKLVEQDSSLCDRWCKQLVFVIRRFFPHSTGCVTLTMQLLQHIGQEHFDAEFSQFLQESLEDLPQVLSMEFSLMTCHANLSNVNPQLQIMGCRWMEHNLAGYLREKCLYVEHLLRLNDSLVNSKLVEVSNVCYLFLAQDDWDMTEESLHNMRMNFSDVFCRDILESPVVSLESKSALIRLVVFLYDADTVAVEDFVLQELRNFRTLTALFQDSIGTIMGPSMRAFIFDCVAPLILFRVFDTGLIDADTLSEYVEAQLYVHKGQMSSKAIEAAAMTSLRAKIALQLKKIPSGSKGYLEVSDYLPSEVLTMLMVSLNLVAADEALFHQLTTDERLLLLIVSSSAHLFLKTRADMIYDRARNGVIDMEYYQSIRERLDMLIAGLAMERITAEAEVFAKDFYSKEMQGLMKQALHRSYQVETGGLFSQLSGQNLEKDAFIQYLDIESIFSKEFLKTTFVFKVLKASLESASEFFTLGGELLRGSRKSAQVKSKAFISKFNRYSDMELWLQADAIYLRNILTYLEDEQDPSVEEYTLFHLICLLTDQNIDEIRNSPYLTLSQKLSRVQDERDRLRVVQNTLQTLGGTQTVLKVLGRSFTTIADGYLLEYTPLAMKLGSSLAAWQNKELQNNFVQSALDGIAVLKPPEYNCLVGYQALIRRCAHEVSYFKVHHGRTSSSVSSPGDDEHQIRVLRACLQVFSLAGSLCSGDNYGSQRFLAGFIDNVQTSVNIAKELCYLTHALALRLSETLVYIDNEQFYEKLAPLVYAPKDSAKRRFLAWHKPANKIDLIAKYVYILSVAFENLISLCYVDTTDEMLLALPKVPAMLEFLGLMQLSAQVKHSGSFGFQRAIKWTGNDPVQFYVTYVREMRAANMLQMDEDDEYQEITAVLYQWANKLSKPAQTKPHNLVWNKHRNFRKLFGISYNFFLTIVRKAEYNCLRLLLSTFEFSTETQARDLAASFNDGILIQNMDNLFQKISRLSMGTRKDETTSTTVAYISLIEAIGIRFRETDDLLTAWDEEYMKRGIRPKAIYGSVELLGADNRLRRLYFPVPTFVLQYWSYPEVQKTKNAIVLDVDRSSPDQKIGDFLRQMTRIYVVMKRQEFLKRLLTYPVHTFFGGKTLPFLQQYMPAQRALGLTLTICLNAYFVYMNTSPFFLRERPDVYSYKEWNTRNIIVYSFQFAHFVLHASFCLRTVINSDAADNLPSWLQSESKVGWAFLSLVKIPIVLLLLAWDSLWSIGLTVMSFFAVTKTYWLYVPCLLDILFQIEAMNFLYLAISRNLFRVISTILLAFLCLYFYAIIAYLFVQDQYNLNGYEGCSNPGSCFLLHIDYGLQNVPEWNSKSYIQPNLGFDVPYARQIEYVLGSFYNITYVVLINLVLQALISGLIIDSFSSMRDENEAKVADIHDKCFICSIPRDDLEQEGVDFKTHITEEHDMWHYVHFMIYLELKDPLSFSSTENYAYHCMADRQTFVKMMPIGRSITLESYKAQKAAADEEKKAEEGQDQFQAILQHLEDAQRRQNALGRVLETLQEHVADQDALRTQQMQQTQAMLHHQQQQIHSIHNSLSNLHLNNTNNNNGGANAQTARRRSSVSMTMQLPQHHNN